jgi:small subunit ribosomal protein S9
MKKATTSKAPKAPAVAKAPKAKKASLPPLAHGVGRRKSSVARVWLRKGSGKIRVNGKDLIEYFDTEITRLAASTPLRIIPGIAYDFDANIVGGGRTGQADALKLGIARALVSIDEELRPKLRENNLLTVDSRIKERKKYGQKAARRKFQFVKR